MISESVHTPNEIDLCPICDGGEYRAVRRAFDDRYGHPGMFDLALCRRCGHVMTLPRLREEDLSQLYGNYYPRKALSAESVVRQAALAQTLRARLSRWWMGNDNQGQFQVRPGERMLDVGCGSGFSLMVARSRGAEVYGVEADPNVQSLAKALDLPIHWGSILDHPFPGVSFDLVVLNQVIEHIPEPGRALEVISSRLASGGRVILVFPNRASLWCRIFGQRWINWHIPYHLHHFDLGGFRRLSARYGLRTVRHRTITPNLWTLLQLRVARRQPVLGQASPVWRVAAIRSDGGFGAGISVRVSAAKSVKKAILALILGLLGVVNRCVDLLGQGDCLMVELKREQDL